MGLKPSIIRVSDKVKIINPEFFIRCGYPKSQKSEIEVVKKEFRHVILNMICSREKCHSFDIDRHNHLLEKVCREIAYARLRNMGYGGNERKIYTERLEEHKDKTFRVVSIKFCKTGKYYPPSGPSGGGYYAEDDYESGGLANEKTHKILHIVPFLLPSSMSAHSLRMMDDPLMIETTNVEKVEDSVV